LRKRSEPAHTTHDRANPGMVRTDRIFQASSVVVAGNAAYPSEVTARAVSGRMNSPHGGRRLPHQLLDQVLICSIYCFFVAIASKHEEASRKSVLLFLRGSGALWTKQADCRPDPAKCLSLSSCRCSAACKESVIGHVILLPRLSPGFMEIPDGRSKCERFGIRAAWPLRENRAEFN
jgi:hypothetical protein